MTTKTIVTALLVLITLSIPLSLYSQSQDFVMNGTVLVKYNGSAASVTIPESVTSIGDLAFGGCTSLTSITIPSSVTSIRGGAFYNCTSLTSITIPSSVTYIGLSAFHDTAWLNSQPDGLVYVNKILCVYKGTMPANTVINNIRADTVAIVDGAFYHCRNLTSITIPEGVTTIGNYAFSGCTSLTSITIPSSVTHIGMEAFDNCISLTSITVSRRTTIRSYTFPYTARITYSD